MSWPTVKECLCTISQSDVNEHALEIIENYRNYRKNTCIILYIIYVYNFICENFPCKWTHIIGETNM